MIPKKLSIREVCIIAFFTALTAVCAQIALPLPFTPVPISLGMVGLYMAAILLPPRPAVLSQTCYLLIGAVGFPVFGGFKGGMGALLGPTGGYLLAYPVMAAVVSLAWNGAKARQARKTPRRAPVGGILAIVAAQGILYTGGTAWLCVTTGLSPAAGISAAVLPFLPLDAVKILVCVAAAIPLRRLLFPLPAGVPGEQKSA